MGISWHVKGKVSITVLRELADPHAHRGWGGWKVEMGHECRVAAPSKGIGGPLLRSWVGGALGTPAEGHSTVAFVFTWVFSPLVFLVLLTFLCVGGGWMCLHLCLYIFLEKACGEGRQKKEAGSEIHPRLHPPRRRWNHGRCQFCKLCP